LDEDAERREQGEIQRREAQLAELTAAEEAQRAQQAQVQQQQQQQQEQLQQLQVEQGGQGDGVEERDLDADIPDADEDVEEEDEEEEDDDVEEEVEDSDGEVTGRFNEESLIEGSMVGGDGLEPGQTQSFLDAEDAEMDGRAQDMRDLGYERNLDDDIPEAGNYEHTDTEAEDDTDEDEEDNEDMMNSSFSLPGSRRRSRRDRASRASEMDISRDDIDDSLAGQSSASYANPWLTRRMDG
jgi:multidrug efflux pump subunit AcrA (membrane-fusion protein)